VFVLSTWSCFIGLAALMLVAGAAPSRADEPACAPESAGLVACIAGRLCSCGFERASQASGLPDGFRWDCGILRPACGGPTPATIDPWQGGLPESLAIDRSRTIIQQRNGNHTGWPHH